MTKFDWPLMSNNINQADKRALTRFIKQSDKVLIPLPTFAMYDVYAKLFKTNLRFLRSFFGSKKKVK